MKTKEQIINKIKDFNKEAKDIFDLKFNKEFQGSGVKFSWSRSDKILRSELRGPSDESIKAFCNDLRKFIQKNDSLKIEKLVPFYQSKLVKEKWKKMFGKQMSEIRRFLDSNSNHTVNGKNFRNKEILEIFLYGKVSHRTEDQKKIHDQLEKNILYLSLKNIFITILHRYLVLINNIVYVNNKVLEDLKNEN